MSVRLEHVLAPIVVVLDFAALSWFGKLATMSGHPETAFRVGTVVFILVNAGVLLFGHRAAPAFASTTRRPATTRARARWTAFAALGAAAIAYRLSAIARTPLDPCRPTCCR